MKNEPTLLISGAAAAALARPGDYLAAVRTAFTDLARDRYEIAPVAHLSGQGGALHIKSASRTGTAPLIVVKANANFPSNVVYGLPTIQGFIALIDAGNGRLLALMDSGEITARRTAAATALAAEHLARRDSRVLAIVGCGVQGRYHVEVLREVLPLAAVRFFDRRPEAMDAFAAHVRNLGLDATPVASARSAAREADVVVTTTTSREPVVTLADVRPGSFVAGVGADNPSKHELAPDLLRAGRVVVDSLAQAVAIGDLHHAMRLGAMSAQDIHGELAEIVAGICAGRTDEAQTFVFDSTGLACQDLAAAELIYERACAREDIPKISF